MRCNSMGSEPQRLLTVKEAAEILHVSVSQVYWLTKQNLLHPVTPADKVRGFRLRESDVLAYANLRLTEVDLVTVAAMAARALALSQSNEKRLNSLNELLGISNFELDTAEDEVVLLVDEAKRVLANDDLKFEVAEIKRWAAILYNMNEGYFRLVTQITRETEPWRLFMKAGEKILQTMSPKELRVRKDLEMAYAFLKAGHRSLLSTAYFYLCTSDNKWEAGKALTHDVDHDIIGILFPAQP